MGLLRQLNPDMADDMAWWLTLLSDREALFNFLKNLDSLVVDQSHHLNPPEHLYRYRRVKNAVKEMKSNSIYLCPSTSFSDPYDTIFSIPGLLKAENIQLSKEQEAEAKVVFDILAPFVSKHLGDGSIKERDVIDNLSNRTPFDMIANAIRSSIRVACFTERHDSFAMWDNYTNGHQGVCFEYDFQKLFKLNGYIYKVCYKEYEFSDFDAGKELHERLGQGLVNSILTKNIDYSYEKEWRYFTGMPGKEYLPVGEALSKIYLGSKISNEDRQQIVDNAPGGVDVVQLKVCTDRFDFKEEIL